MSKFRIRRLAHDTRECLREEFYRTFASLRSLEEVQAACRDLFTAGEIIMFVRRMHIARLLIAGHTYKQIGKMLHAGDSTIKTVANRLSRGGKGFEIIHERLSIILEEISVEISHELKRLDPYGAERLKQNYPTYFWPELLAREAPKIIRNAKAARGRRQSLSKK